MKKKDPYHTEKIEKLITCVSNCPYEEAETAQVRAAISKKELNHPDLYKINRINGSYSGTKEY